MLLRQVAAFALSAGLLCTATTWANAETVTIRYSNWLPPKFFLLEDVIKPWIAEVEKVTEGRVKVEITPKVVGSVASQFDVVREGLADLSYIPAGYTPGRFPLLEFGELPLVGSGKGADLGPGAQKIFSQFIEPHIDLQGVKILTLTTQSPIQLFTNGKPVKTVEDIKGLKLRASSATLTEVEKLLGAVPVAKSADEAREMISTGALDGQVTLPNTITGFNQLEILDSGYRIAGGLGNNTVMWGMNAAKWAQISPADQEAILKISGEAFASKVGTAYDAADEQAYEKMKAEGYTIIDATAEDTEKLKTMIAPIYAAWIEKATKAGLPDAAKVLEAYDALASGKSAAK